MQMTENIFFWKYFEILENRGLKSGYNNIFG
jgi:hypothetical protein